MLSLAWFEQERVKAAIFVVFKVANVAIIAKDPHFSILSSFCNINFVVFRIRGEENKCKTEVYTENRNFKKQ